MRSWRGKIYADDVKQGAETARFVGSAVRRTKNWRRGNYRTNK